MLPIGTKVRIKSWKEIQKTLDKDDRCDGLYFNSKMQDYCGILCVIESQGSNFCKLEGIPNHYWAPQWFDVVRGAEFLNDGSIEQRSLCLALIRQTMSGYEPDVKYLRDYNGPAFPSKILTGFSYSHYPQDKWKTGKKIAENIPDWPCLKLKPEILEEAIKNCLSQRGLQWFVAYVEHNIDYWFGFDDTKKVYFWYDVAEILSTTHLETIKDTNIEQPYKTKENEIKFQRKKGCVLRGTVPEGNQQSSGKCKIATCSGHLGYQVCSGR